MKKERDFTDTQVVWTQRESIDAFHFDFNAVKATIHVDTDTKQPTYIWLFFAFIPIYIKNGQK